MTPTASPPSASRARARSSAAFSRNSLPSSTLPKSTFSAARAPAATVCRTSTGDMPRLSMSSIREQLQGADHALAELLVARFDLQGQGVVAHRRPTAAGPAADRPASRSPPPSGPASPAAGPCRGGTASRAPGPRARGASTSHSTRLSPSTQNQAAICVRSAASRETTPAVWSESGLRATSDMASEVEVGDRRSGGRGSCRAAGLVTGACTASAGTTRSRAGRRGR